jgi:hypothetical protein
MALFDIVVLLPGNPVVTSLGGFLVVVAVQTLLIWRLYRRSGIAWSLVVFFSGSFAVAGVLFLSGQWETTLVITCLLALMQVVLIFTPPVLAYVFGRDEAVVSH